MKVLISRKDLKDTTSGVPKKVLQELHFFNEKGFKAYAIAETINHEMVKEFGGVPVKTWRWPFSGYFRRKFYQKNVSRWIERNQPKLVIGHGDILEQDVLFIHNCVHLAHELVEGKPIPRDHEVGLIHEEIFNQGKFKLLVCNSQMVKTDLVTRFKLDPKKAVVIYPEINTKKFPLENRDKIRSEWRKKFGFDQSHFVFGIITSGNFKKRNLATLIDAFADVAGEYPCARLFVAGANIEKKYLQQIDSLGIKEKIVLAEPIIDVNNYYHLIDTFILPAHIEEFGRSVLEAMYCGKPVITSDKVGASEIFEGEARQFILESRNKNKLAELMIKLVQDSELCFRLSKINSDIASKYDSNLQNHQFGDILTQYKII